MSISAKPMVQGIQLPNAAAAQYTCPSNTVAVIRHATFCNTSAASVTLTAEVVPNGGAAGNASMVIPSQAIAAGATFVSNELAGIALKAGDTLQMFASTVSAISASVSGFEQT